MSQTTTSKLTHSYCHRRRDIALGPGESIPTNAGAGVASAVGAAVDFCARVGPLTAEMYISDKWDPSTRHTLGEGDANDKFHHQGLDRHAHVAHFRLPPRFPGAVG